MIQLAYQPAYDPFHAIYRYFYIVSLTDSIIELDRYRIVDYYVCFPGELEDFRFQPAHRKFKPVARAVRQSRQFERLPSKQLLISRMRLMQQAALQTLEREGYLRDGGLDEMRLVPTALEVPIGVAERIAAKRAEEPVLTEALEALLNEYDVVGPQGLKARSGLLEHKYDAI